MGQFSFSGAKDLVCQVGALPPHGSFPAENVWATDLQILKISAGVADWKQILKKHTIYPIHTPMVISSAWAERIGFQGTGGNFISLGIDPKAPISNAVEVRFKHSGPIGPATLWYVKDWRSHGGSTYQPTRISVAYTCDAYNFPARTCVSGKSIRFSGFVLASPPGGHNPLILQNQTPGSPSGKRAQQFILSPQRGHTPPTPIGPVVRRFRPPQHASVRLLREQRRFLRCELHHESPTREGRHLLLARLPGRRRRDQENPVHRGNPGFVFRRNPGNATAVAVHRQPIQLGPVSGPDGRSPVRN